MNEDLGWQKLGDVANDVLAKLGATPLPEADLVYEEIERVTGLAESYSRSAGEAAHRGDKLTLEVHLKQMRLCIISAIRAFKDFL